MGLLTLCSVPRGRFLYTLIVSGGEFLLPSSRVPGVCLGRMVMDEIDTCIIHATLDAEVGCPEGSCFTIIIYLVFVLPTAFSA